jgi:hypothetical protein
MPDDDRPTVPVPRPSPDEVRALRLQRFKRDSERLLALRQELLGMGIGEPSASVDRFALSGVRRREQDPRSRPRCCAHAGPACDRRSFCASRF